jgi:hypothetical protein
MKHPMLTGFNESGKTTPRARLHGSVKLRSQLSVFLISVFLSLSFVGRNSLLPVLAETQAGGADIRQSWNPAIPKPLSEDSDQDFTSIFDGKSLKNWDGDPKYWRIEHGAIVGETTAATPLAGTSTFIIWRGGVLENFELRLEYRISPGGNSGIYYRSEEPPQRKWALGGYQADIDGPEWGKAWARDLREAGVKIPSARSPFGLIDPPDSFRVTGQNYDELVDGMGRAFLALPGELTYIGDGKVQRVIGYLAEGDQINRISTNGWNEMRVIARKGLLIHILNGYVTSIVIDEDTRHRHMRGKLGLQLHPGPPMKVEFRRIRLKSLQDAGQ